LLIEVKAGEITIRMCLENGIFKGEEFWFIQWAKSTTPNQKVGNHEQPRWLTKFNC